MGKKVEKLNMEADVIVIGGGLSGLAAADGLKNHDSSLRVIVLEANEQVKKIYR